MNKKLLSIITGIFFVSSICLAPVSAADIQNNHQNVKIASIPVKINKSVKNKHDINFTVDVYGTSKKKTYAVKEVGDGSLEDKKAAFEVFNQMMESGSIQETAVSVSSFYTDYSGIEWDDDQTNYLGYSSAHYNAGNLPNGGTDRTWGGSSCMWTGSGTPKYIFISQTQSLNVTDADATVSINWGVSATGPEIGGGVTLTETQTSSKCTWTSNQVPNETILGSEYGETEFSWDDIQGGCVTSCVHTDKGNISYGATIYKPSTQVRFTNGF